MRRRGDVTEYDQRSILHLKQPRHVHRYGPTGAEDEIIMTQKPTAEVAHPVDIYVGARMRIRRKVLGLSQTQLADALGITFQQIQKYERGANRISASKLYDAARLLQSPVSYFFDGLEETDNGEDDGVAQRMTQFVATPEGLELADLFPRLNDRRLRRRVVDLVKAMVDDEPA
jgi:hypothetical protein